MRLSLAAAGVNPDADVVLLAYVAGILISSLPLLPGGFGAVEAAIPALLHHFGAPLDAALVYRAISVCYPRPPERSCSAGRGCAGFHAAQTRRGEGSRSP